LHPRADPRTLRKIMTKEDFPLQRPDEEWRRELSPEAYHVLREHGTERAGASPLNYEHRDGVFRCAACGVPLFTSDTKFESGSGWPSFFRPIPGAVATSEDASHSMRRTEVHCANCGGHLGHVFPDGPQPTGERYCMNGVALRFEPAKR
jgi:peptide-methionine (R)-S-oxide reductase